MDFEAQVDDLSTKLAGALARSDEAQRAASTAAKRSKQLKARVDRATARIAAIEGSRAWRLITSYRKMSAKGFPVVRDDGRNACRKICFES